VPNIAIDDAQADPEFSALISSVIARLPFDDDRHFPPAYQKLYEILKQQGRHALLAEFNRRASSEVERDIELHHFGMHLGDVVFAQLSDEQKRRFFPFNDVEIDVFDDGVKAVLRSLPQATLDGKPLPWKGRPCYFSYRRPTIEIDGVSKVICYTEHAVEQICSRACAKWKTYGGLGDAFAFFADCLYFEKCEIRGANGSQTRQPAVSFFQDCFLDRYRVQIWKPPSEYFVNVIGPHPDHLTKHWYYRVGYCPIQVRGDFALCITLLSPGFSATPEYALLEASDLPPDKKCDMLQRARENTYENVFKTFDYELARWFHQNGIPQVCDLPGDVFARPEGAPPRRAPIDSPLSDFYRLPEKLKAREKTSEMK
jgi:hypothetical protein